MVLPVASLAIQSIAGWSRYVRATMLEVLHQDYIRTAKAKGLGSNRVNFRHALRNALIPVVTLGGLQLGALLSGGIDSPVAAHMMMTRGLRVVYLNFHSYPFIGDQSKEKVIDLVRFLSRYFKANTLLPVAISSAFLMAWLPTSLAISSMFMS